MPRRAHEGAPGNILDDYCRGRWWWARVPLLVWFGYMLVRSLLDPAYSSLFVALNLAIHEIGHILWSPFGQFLEILGGSLTQCLAPLVSMGFFLRQRDYFAAAFCFGWLGLNLFEVALYVGDARAMGLSLVTPGGGDAIHDWNWILGRLGLLQMDRMFAWWLRAGGAVCMLAFLGIGGYMAVRMAQLRGPRGEAGQRV